MRIYISTDLEGASGIWRQTQVSPDYPAEYAYGKRCLTRDVNVVVDAAFENGATEIVVWDGHGPGGLDWDDLDPRVTIERTAFQHGTFPSLDERTDCAFLIGQHAMAGTPRAFLSHTQSSRSWFEWKMNDEPCGELGQFAACAGHYDVPLALVSGDRAACVEAEALLPGVATAEVKYARVRNQCCCHPAARVRELLAEATRLAMDRVRAGEVPPRKLKTPIDLEITLQRADIADDFERSHPDWQRVSGRTLRRQAADQRNLYGA